MRNNPEIKGGEGTHLGNNHHQLHLPAHLGHGAHLTLVFPGVSGRHVLDLKISTQRCLLQLGGTEGSHLEGPQVLPGFDQRGEPGVRDECFLIHSNDVAVRPSDPGD